MSLGKGFGFVHFSSYLASAPGMRVHHFGTPICLRVEQDHAFPSIGCHI